MRETLQSDLSIAKRFGFLGGCREETKPHDPMDEARRSFYMLWKTDDQPEEAKRVYTIPAPKMKLPGRTNSII